MALAAKTNSPAATSQRAKRKTDGLRFPPRGISLLAPMVATVAVATVIARGTRPIGRVGPALVTTPSRVMTKAGGIL